MIDENPTAFEPEPDEAPAGAGPASGRNALSGRVLWGCLAVLAVVLIFATGAMLGFGYGRLSAGSIATPSANSSTADQNLRSDLQEKFGVFWEAMDVLYGNYYGKLPEGTQGAYAAIKGLVRELDDPHTSFYTPEEAKIFRESLTGSFEGIGARVEWDEDAKTVRIVEPFENQPAWLAGIRRGDLVMAVDGESVVGTDLNGAVSKIRGPKGSKVKLTILREAENDGQTFDVEVKRDRIETPTVSAEAMGDARDIGYIRLYSFNENSGALLKQAVEDAVKRGVKGMILDLRGNTGGLLREAVKVSSLFLKDQVVLYERFKDGKEEVYRTSGDATALDVPLVVLVNEGSASASEIVAGALQDARRATLVGATTFGKGSVQIPEPLDDGSIMRVTIARWFTPNNRTIDGTGLTPDVEVAISDADRAAAKDPQLERALQEVRRRIEGEPAPAPAATSPITTTTP